MPQVEIGHHERLAFWNFSAKSKASMVIEKALFRRAREEQAECLVSPCGKQCGADQVRSAPVARGQPGRRSDPFHIEDHHGDFPRSKPRPMNSLISEIPGPGGGPSWSGAGPPSPGAERPCRSRPAHLRPCTMAKVAFWVFRIQGGKSASCSRSWSRPATTKA